ARDSSAEPGAFDLGDVDALLARELPHRGRRSYLGEIGTLLCGCGRARLGRGGRTLRCWLRGARSLSRRLNHRGPPPGGGAGAREGPGSAGLRGFRWLSRRGFCFCRGGLCSRRLRGRRRRLSIRGVEDGEERPDRDGLALLDLDL